MAGCLTVLPSSLQKKCDDLYSKLEPRLLYSAKSEIYGTCIRLLTDQLDTKNTWEDNFYQMSESVRSHGRLVVLQDKDQENRCKV